MAKNGRPVWPINDEGDRAALQRLVRLFGGRSQEVSGRPAPSRCGREVALGLGDASANEARLYAHLTRRRYRYARRLTDVLGKRPPAVVVTTLDRVDSDLLEWLYPVVPRVGSVPGIVCARDAPSLRRQVLLRSAAAEFRGPAGHSRVDVIPSLQIGRTRMNGAEILGGRASPHAIRAALARGAGVLTIRTHADGMDAFLGSRLTLCPMDQLPTGADPERSPRCWATGVCHRHPGTVGSVLRSGVVISPDGFSARVLVLDVCRGLLPADGPLDPAWGFLYRMLHSPLIGAILTPWEITISDFTLTDVLSSALDRGVPAGRALAALLRSTAARRHGYRMCLLGDPRVRAQ